MVVAADHMTRQSRLWRRGGRRIIS